jgi:hypothetical protein
MTNSTSGKFLISSQRYIKSQLESTGVVSNVNLFTKNQSTPVMFNLNISTSTIFSSSDYLVVRVLVANGTLSSSNSTKYLQFANTLMVYSASFTNYQEP